MAGAMLRELKDRPLSRRLATRGRGGVPEEFCPSLSASFMPGGRPCTRPVPGVVGLCRAGSGTPTWIRPGVPGGHLKGQPMSSRLQPECQEDFGGIHTVGTGKGPLSLPDEGHMVRA